MKKALVVILSTVFTLISGWVSAQDFILNNPTMNPNPATFPGGTETITFNFSSSANYTFSNDPLSNSFTIVTFSFTKLNPTGITPTGTGAALFDWTLTDNGGSGSGLTYTWTGKTKAISMNAVPASYSISFNNVPVTMAATQAQTDIRVAGQFQDPANVPTGNEANNFSEIATYSQAPLPVTYGYTNAKFADKKLSVEWSTLTEINNKSFIIEVSKDGKQFVTIDTVATKAVGGNSNEEIKYAYSKDLASVLNVLGYSPLQMMVMAVLVLSVIVSLVRAKRSNALLAIVLLMAVGFGCRKNDHNEVNDKDHPATFVRVSQIDIDGTVGSPSKVVKVVVE